jgi:hypothetical protein
VCKRLGRAGVRYAGYWTPLGAGERAAVFAVAGDSLPLVPADTPGLEPATGERAARRLAHFIDLIPADLPSGAHRRGTRGPLEWKATEGEADDGAEAGGGTGDGVRDAGAASVGASSTVVTPTVNSRSVNSPTASVDRTRTANDDLASKSSPPDANRCRSRRTCHAGGRRRPRGGAARQRRCRSG